MNKRQGRGEEIHLTPSIVHMPLCMCECLCNLFFTPIESFNSFVAKMEREEKMQAHMLIRLTRLTMGVVHSQEPVNLSVAIQC
jgi:hypothetical protein